jgi:hypothetical protein
MYLLLPQITGRCEAIHTLDLLLIMLTRKHLVALAYQPLRSTINIHRRALCTQKGKIELEEKKNEHQDKKEQGEQENHKEQVKDNKPLESKI